MQKFYLTILSGLLLVMTGCAAPGECPVVDAFTILHAMDANPRSDYNGGRGTSVVSVTPDTIRVKHGCNFVIRNQDDATITTESGEMWLRHTTPTKEDITLGPAECATDPCTEADIYKFKIVVDGIGELDPRARVRH